MRRGFSGGGGPSGLSPVGAANTIATSDGTGVSWANALTLAGGYVRFSATKYMLHSDGSSCFLFGDNAFGNQHSTGRIYASSQIIMGIGSTNYIQLSGDQISLAKPLAGRASTNGLQLQVTPKTWPSDANYTLANSEIEGVILVLTGGALTATRDLIVPVTNGVVYVVVNTTSGGQSIRIGPGGSGVTVANGMTAIVRANGTTCVRVTADV